MTADVDPPQGAPDARRDPVRIADRIFRGGFKSVRVSVRRSLLDLHARDTPSAKGMQARRITPQAEEAAARLERLDSLLVALLSRGLVVVLDAHDDAPRFGDAGFKPGEGTPRAAGPEPWVSFWLQQTRRWAGRSDRLLFELSFEAHLSPTLKNDLLAKTVQAIRARDPARVLVIGWDDPIGLSQMKLPDDEHLIVGVTHVEPFRFTRQGLPGDEGRESLRGGTCCSPQEIQLMALPLELAKTWSITYRHPVWVRGVVSHQRIPVAWRAHHARLTRQAAEERGLSWSYGDFRSEFGLVDPTTGSWQVPMLRALLGT
ncbi:MAG: hypothetical protein RLZZ618_289 [Pseudomonadota bacterium]|jgi:endoglucanase